MAGNCSENISEDLITTQKPISKHLDPYNYIQTTTSKQLDLNSGKPLVSGESMLLCTCVLWVRVFVRIRACTCVLVDV